MDMQYYLLRVTNLVAMASMAAMYMVNLVKKLQNSEEKRQSISHFYNIDHRYIDLVCMCRSTCTTLLFKTATLPNIWLIWLPPYVGLLL